MELKVGQLLYRSCSCDDFAKILKVGKDENGHDVIDVELLEDLNDLYFPEPAEDTEEGRMTMLTRIELPKGTPVIIRNVQWRPVVGHPDAINCYMTTGGCYRCTSLFFPHDEGDGVFGPSLGRRGDGDWNAPLTYRDVEAARAQGAAVAFGLMGMAEAIRNRHAFEVRMPTVDRDIAGIWWRFPGDGSAPYRI